MTSDELQKIPQSDKQIEEIYRTLLAGCNGIECFECEGAGKNDGCLHYHNAHSIYNAGYRKASDVAKEIFEELEKYLVTSCTVYTQAIHAIGVGTFAMLKKKYTEEQK